MSYKTVRVSYDNSLELIELKAELGLRDFDEVIGFYVILQNFPKQKLRSHTFRMSAPIDYLHIDKLFPF